MKKIAIFTAFYLPHLGGVERYTANLCKEFKNHGYDITVITCNYDSLNTIEKTDICTIYRLPIYNILKQRCPLVKRNKEYKNIMEKLECEKFDSIIINTQLYTLSVIGAKFARRNNIPCCLIEHGTNHISFNNKIIDKLVELYEHILTNIIRRYVDDFYGVSKECVNWLKHFKIKAKGVFYNSVDTGDYDIYKDSRYDIEKSKQEIIITYASRVIKEKGILNLIEAYKIIRKEHNNVKLVVAGDGPLLKQLIEENRKNEDIIFTRTLKHEEIMSLYNITDIFVHPSMYPEGLPTSILEAGLMKCCIIATNRGGTVEVIDDNKNGLIVDENINDLVEKLRDVIANNDKMEEYKEKINITVREEFSWKNTVNKIIKSIKTN